MIDSPPWRLISRGRPVNVILASGGTLPARAAKMATSTIPIVFTTILDPVAPGLVASLNRPGGNLTGVSFLIGELMAKQVGLLHDLIPAATTFALLINPDNSDVSNLVLKTAQTAAGALQVELRVLTAKTNVKSMKLLRASTANVQMRS